MDNDHLFSLFTDFISFEKGLSLNTISSYLPDLRIFAEFLKVKRKKKLLLQADSSDLRAFITYRGGLELKGISIRREISSVSQFYLFLSAEKLMDADIISDLASIKIDKKLPVYLNSAEVEALLNAPDNQSRNGRRDKLIFELMYACGARVSEICSLKISDIDLHSQTVLIKGKGKKQRIVPLHQSFMELLKAYLLYTRNTFLNASQTDYLILNKNGKNLSRISIWKIVKKYSLQTGIKKNISPHTLRHSFATHLVQQGADLRSVQEMLGHADISTTEIYTHLGIKDLHHALEISHPLYH